MPKELNRVQQLFFRGSNRPPAISDRFRYGLGQGLYISHNVVEAHRGRLNITSTPNVGTQVEVLLPIHASMPALQ